MQHWRAGGGSSRRTHRMTGPTCRASSGAPSGAGSRSGAPILPANRNTRLAPLNQSQRTPQPFRPIAARASLLPANSTYYTTYLSTVLVGMAMAVFGADDCNFLNLGYFTIFCLYCVRFHEAKENAPLFRVLRAPLP
eukprot:7792217-Pyramimonas_sp.AAC.1